MATPRKSQRQVVFSYDVMRLRGRSIRSARYTLKKVRLTLGKGPYEDVTVIEYCHVMGVDEETVRKVIDEADV